MNALNFQVSASTPPNGPNWLSVSQAQGSAAAGGTATIAATAAPLGVNQGVYRGAVTVSYPGVSIDVPAYLVVGSNNSTLVTSETGVYLQAEFAGSPVTQVIDVANAGLGTLAGLTVETALVDAESNWLQVSLPSGFAGQSDALVGITVNPGTLPAGVYFAEIRFTLPHANNSPQIVGVLMEVVDSVPPTVTPKDAVLSGANSMPQVFTISNPTTQTVSFTVGFDPMTDPSNAGWVSFSPSSGSIPPGGTAQLTLKETVSGCASSSNCENHLVTGAHAYLDVVFPALNKTIIFGIELAPSQKFCAEGFGSLLRIYAFPTAIRATAGGGDVYTHPARRRLYCDALQFPCSRRAPTAARSPDCG